MTRPELETLYSALNGLIGSYRRVHGLDGAYDPVLARGEAALKLLEREIGEPNVRDAGSAFGGGRSTDRERT